MSAIVTFIGEAESGKEELARQVVSELALLGYRVAVIRAEDDGVLAGGTLPEPVAYAQAGAQSVLQMGQQQMVLQTENRGTSLVTLAHRFFPDADIIVGTGFDNERKIAKIEVCRQPAQRLREQVTGVIAVATDLEEIVENYLFRLHEAREIAQFLVKRLLQGQAAREKAVLLVNGHKVPIKGFIQEALAGTIEGFVSSLKFCDTLEEVEIRLRFADK